MPTAILLEREQARTSFVAFLPENVFECSKNDVYLSKMQVNNFFLFPFFSQPRSDCIVLYSQDI